MYNIIRKFSIAPTNNNNSGNNSNNNDCHSKKAEKISSQPGSRVKKNIREKPEKGEEEEVDACRKLQRTRKKERICWGKVEKQNF